MTDAFDLLMEARWEMEGVRRATARYRAAAATADPATLPSGQKLLREIVPPLAERIRELQAEGMDRSSGRTNLWAAPLQLLDAEILAVITITRALHGAEMTTEQSYTARLSIDIADAVQSEIAYRAWISAEAAKTKEARAAEDWTHVDLAAVFKKRHPTADSRSWKRFAAKLEVAREPWDANVSVQVGTALISALLAAAPAHFTMNMKDRGNMRTQGQLRLSDETRLMLRDIEVRAEVAHPRLAPMLIPPIPWCRKRIPSGKETAVAYTGGYVIHTKPAIRTGLNIHTSGLEEPLSDADLAAMNAVQSTPWRINRWLFDVMEEAWANGQRIGGLEVNEPELMPRLSDTDYAALTETARIERRAARLATHIENDSIMGRSRAVMDALSVASELRDKVQIYFPHSKDWRGRIYPLDTFGPHPQGADIQKALIMFAEGVPLGEDGLYWLLVRAANSAGQDKLSLEDRVTWALDHQRQIEASAKDPLGYTWWADIAEGEEPWNLLATCYELASALSMSKPAEFVSHLPVPVDGSCNGLQHLTALGLDPVGAVATNLTPTTREDIYEAVAVRVRARVEQDVLDGVDMARVWYGKVSRAAVKRAVMTTPYGVTDRGIRDQLMADGHVPGAPGPERGAAADYLRDCLVAAMTDTVQSARSIMAWLQTTADRLARAKIVFEWSTPSGSRVRQAYFDYNRTQLRTLVGSVILWHEHLGASLSIRQQAQGSAPNVIHSFDAAHLTMTVNAGAADGIEAWAMIHDSYGTHAGLTTRLAGILREQFVTIYKQDWLTMIKADIAAYAPHVVVDDPPARGSFDIEQVRNAPYFFS